MSKNKVVRDEPLMSFTFLIITIILTIIFTILKLFGVIDWNIIAILLPLIIGVATKIIDLIILAIKIKFRIL